MQVIAKVKEVSQELLDAEWKLEEEAFGIAIERVQAKVDERGLDNSQTGKRKVGECLADMAQAVEEWLAEEEAATRRPSNAYKYLKVINPHHAAFVTCKEVVHTLGMSEAVLVASQEAIGTRLRDMVEVEIFQESNPDAAENALFRAKYAKSEGKSERVLKVAMTDAGIEGLKWTTEDMNTLGHILLNIFIDSIGMVEIQEIQRGIKTKKILVPAPEMAEWLAEHDMAEAFMAPFHFPMVIPPLPFTNVYDGGYLNKRLHKTPLLRTRRKAEVERIESVDMPEVYAAVNSISQTPWRINKRILEVYSALLKEDTGEAGLPSSVMLDFPEKPWGDDLTRVEFDLWKEFNKDAFAEWRGRAAEVGEENSRNRSKKFSADQKKFLADKFEEYESIYFPHTLDFRGRIYPVAGAGAISPQGDDSGKALLEFSTGKPLGDSGGFWLLVHTANCWGNDKVSLDERVQWCTDNKEDLESYARDPLVNRGWTKADKPFGFLAACFEFAGFMSVGDGFVSRLPIALDGSCSGLQHFGAMLRDEYTCRNVNVLPNGTDRPSDVYSLVKDTVIENLKGEEDILADEWATRLTRSIIKQPVMTTPYGVTARGIRDQLIKNTRKQVAKKTIEAFSVPVTDAASYLAPFVDSAIGTVVSAAESAMKWLRVAAGEAAKGGHHVSWTTPTGFYVTQDYRKLKAKRLKMTYRGRQVRLNINVRESTLSKSNQVSGISPNFVHSLDASHLMKTVNRCFDNDISNFAMIHDSFGTHASDTEVLWLALREEFVEMYAGDVLRNFYEELREQLPPDVFERIPEPPKPADLELDAVKSSEFFFA